MTADYSTSTQRDQEERVTVLPAVLGWANPERDAENLRLYALDRGQSPRFDGRTGRVVEQALRESVTPYPSGMGEGDRYLVVRLGSRFVNDHGAALMADRIADLLADHADELEPPRG